MSHTEDYEILLYYLYTPISDTAALRQNQLDLCNRLNLKGRIIIATEGINGTVGGLKKDTQAYIDACKNDPVLKPIVFKRSVGIPNAFPKLTVKVRKEVVSAHLGEEDVDPNQTTGVHLKPEELQSWFENGEDFTIIDMRNSYEYQFGRFKDSIDPGMRKFSELSQVTPKLEQYKKKKVLTVCTGGIRCEKASGHLIKKGFEQVYQLDGGMVSYMEKYPGQNFEGSLFVFDNRQTMHFNDPKTHKTLNACLYCAGPAERLKNCDNPICNLRCVVCAECDLKDSSRFCPDCEKNMSTTTQH